MKNHYVGALLLAAAILVFTGCDQQQAEPSASVAEGQVIFMENCSGCHPRTGRGDYLKKIPVSLLIMKSHHELKTWIRGSGEHREMPNFDSLSEQELAALADYLHNEIGK